MKVLIVGSGGREHAIAASAAKSSKVEKMYCAPGNAGIEEFAECVPIGAMEFEKLVAFAKEKSIGSNKGSDTGRHQNCRLIHSCCCEHGWIDCKDIRHCHKCGDTR